MRALILIVSLAAATSLATTSAGTSSAAGTRLDLTGCHYLESLNVVPSALVRPYVPDDFSLAATANLVVGMATCDATLSTGETDVVTFGWADVSVYPPTALRSPAGGLHLYRIEHLAMDDLYGAAHAAFGTQCRVLDNASVLSSLLDVHATGAIDGASVWDMRVPAGVPEDGTTGATHYREFGRANGGYAYLEGDLIVPGVPSLPGTFLVDSQSPLYDLWGPAWPSRIIAGSSFAITDTTIGFLPWPGVEPPAQTC